MSRTLTRRDRFLFQYPPFATMRPGQAPDFSLPAPTGENGKKEGFQLYLHIPFCAVRCTFCYYGMMPNTYRRFAEPYLEDLYREIDMLADLPYLHDREVETLYFGGGTPTYLDEPKLEALVEHLRRRFRFASDLEFTCEGEPTTIHQESKLRLLKDLGVNRMSFGVQSFHPDIAKINGRLAKPPIVARMLEWAKKTGFRVMNIDLMSGMLGETMDTWQYSIDRLLEYEPEHITIYRMEVKPGTQFFTQLQFNPEQREQFVGDELELEMIDYAEKRFSGLGYSHHTHFSWILKPEFEHIHRTNCWQGRDLIAIGESSFGFANGYLYQNESPYLPYAKVVAEGQLPIACAHRLSRKEQMTGHMVMGLKLLGINRKAFHEQFGTDPLEVFGSEIRYLEEAGAVEVDEQAITVGGRGCMYADSFARVFYPPEYLQMDEVAVGTPDYGKKKKVLLIDDDTQARTALRLMLESNQLECIEVGNGSEALQWLAKQETDIIISDNKMPVLSGLDFLEQTQLNKKLPSEPPIILLCGNLNQKEKQRARQTGAFAIFNKPCNFSELLSKIQLALTPKIRDGLISGITNPRGLAKIGAPTHEATSHQRGETTDATNRSAVQT